MVNFETTNSTRNTSTTSVIHMVWREGGQTTPRRGQSECVSYLAQFPEYGVSCQQLLVAESSAHGCPYRYFSPENLQTALLSAYSSEGLTANDLPEIMSIVNSRHYHVACTRVFEITHSKHGVKKGEGVGGGESVTHPNQYATRSMELDKAKKESVKTEPAAMDVDP